MARVKDIDELIASGDLPDPMYGNYRVVPIEEAIVIAPNLAEEFTISAFNSQVVANSGGIYRPTSLAKSTFGQPASGRRLALAAADFDGDGIDEVLWASEESGAVRVQVGRLASGGIAPATFLDLAIAPTGEIALLTGGFHIAAGSASSTPDAVLAWVDASRQLHLELLEVAPDLQISLRSSAVDGAVKASLSAIALTAGDLVGDGVQVVVVASPSPLDRLRVAAYTVEVTDESWALTLRGSWESEEIAAQSNISACCADFDVDAADEIAVAWESPAGYFALRIISADASYQLLPKGRYEDTAQSLAGNRSLAVAGGRLGISLPTGDEADRPARSTTPEPSQIAVGYEIDNHLLQMRVIESDINLNLGSRAVKCSDVFGVGLSYHLLSERLQLQVSSIGGGAINAIVVGALGKSGNPWTVSAGFRMLTVGLVAVAPDLGQIGPLDPTACHTDGNIRDRGGRYPFALVTGDLTGASLRVGLPRRHQASRVNHVLAVLNAPPTHVVKVGTDETNLNFNGGSYLTFQNANHQQTTLQFQTTKNWGYSKDLRSSLNLLLLTIESGLTNRYGENFERVSTNANSYTFSISTPVLWREDQAVLMVTDYTVWEYDVFDGNGGEIGPMAVIFPSTTKPHVQVQGTRSLGAYYTPDHLVGNILSYRAFGDIPPECDGESIILQVTRDVGITATDDAMTWQTTGDDIESRRKDQSLSVGESARFNPQFKGIGFGISLQLESEYSESEFTSTQSMIQETTNIGVAFAPFEDPVPQGWMYRVQPIWYWARDWGYLAVDYLIDIPGDSKYPSQWQRTYTKADLAFALPYSSDPVYALLTRDLECTVLPNGDVTIAGVVRNFSPISATNVEVGFYNGEPSSGSIPVATTIVPAARARQVSSFSATWPAPPSGILDVWAVIDPGDKIPDLYRGNNRGWTRIEVPAR